MLPKRLIACFDVKNVMVTKAHKFQNNIDIDTVENVARKIYEDQIDEIIFYDITASSEKRKIDLETVKRVAKHVFVPFTVGGGIKNLGDMYEVLKAGAEKISIDSMAVRNPNIVHEGALAFGRQCIVLSMQVKRVKKTPKIPSGYKIAIDGARVFISNNVNIPVIASGGAGNPKHLVEVFTKTGASAAIISSMLYSPLLNRNYSVKAIKEKLMKNKIPVRPWIENYNV
jgi:cyclase